METDRVRRSSARDQEPVLGAGLGELAVEPENEGVHAVVGDQEVRAEPDREDVHSLPGRPGESLLELVDRPGPREVAGGAADPDGRQAAERNVLLDRQRHACRIASAAPAASSSLHAHGLSSDHIRPSNSQLIGSWPGYRGTMCTCTWRHSSPNEQT